MKRTLILIEPEDAERYRKSIKAVQKRMITSFYQSSDMSFRKWVNTHGPILDELLDELKMR